MLIIEGPDGSGKSTLVKAFQDMLNIPVAPKVVDQDTSPMIDSLATWTEQNLRAGYQDVIFDRHRLISEPIYSTAMGGERDREFWSSQTRLSRWYHRFNEISPTIIFCLPPLEDVEKNCQGYENRIVRPFIPQIYRGYQAQMAMRRNQATFTFDYTDPRFNDHFLLWVANTHKERARDASGY